MTTVCAKTQSQSIYMYTCFCFAAKIILTAESTKSHIQVPPVLYMSVVLHSVFPVDEISTVSVNKARFSIKRPVDEHISVLSRRAYRKT